MSFRFDKRSGKLVKQNFELHDVVLYFPYGICSSVQYAGKVILIHKNYVTVQFPTWKFESVRNFTIICGYAQGHYKEPKRQRGFIRKASSKEIALEARKEAFQIIKDFFSDEKNLDDNVFANWKICNIQNTIEKQNQIISMYESER